MYTAEFTVEFVSVSPEVEEAYWFAIEYFCKVMFEDLLLEIVLPQTEGRGLGEGQDGG